MLKSYAETVFHMGLAAEGVAAAVVAEHGSDHTAGPCRSGRIPRVWRVVRLLRRSLRVRRSTGGLILEGRLLSLMVNRLLVGLGVGLLVRRLSSERLVGLLLRALAATS